MKKTHKIFDVKNFELTAGTIFMTGAAIIVASKLYEMDKNNSNGEINIIKDPTEITTTEVSNTAIPEYTYTEIDPVSDEYYRSIVIQGRTLNFENTPSPTPTPNYELIDAYTDDMITGEDGIYPEGYAEYAERKEHSLNFKTVEEATSFYAKVFEIKEDVALNVISNLDTNTYDLNTACVINGKEYATFETGIAHTIFDLYKNPDNYGYTSSDIKSSEGYQLSYYIPEELIYKFCKVLNVNPKIALAIAYGECGRKLNSYICVNNYNYGGIVSNGGFAHYLNPAEGQFEFVYKLNVQYFVTADSGYSRLKAMSYGYCEDSSYWINLVGSIYYELENNGYDYSYYKFSYQGRDLIYCDQEEESFYRSRYYKGN